MAETCSQNGIASRFIQLIFQQAHRIQIKNAGIFHNALFYANLMTRL